MRERGIIGVFPPETRFNPFHGMRKLHEPVSENGIGTSEAFRIPDFGTAVIQLIRLSARHGLTEDGISLIRFTATQTITRPLRDSIGHLEVFVCEPERGFTNSANMGAVMEHRGEAVAVTDPDWMEKWGHLVEISHHAPADIAMAFERIAEPYDGDLIDDPWTAEDNRFVVGTQLSQLKIPMFYFNMVGSAQ